MAAPKYFGAAIERRFHTLGQPEARPYFIIRCDRRSGRGLVHGPVLCALLSADDSQSEHYFGQLHRGRRAVSRDAVLCFVWRAFGSPGTQEDHDARLHPGGNFLFADLSRDAGSHRLEHCDRNITEEFSDWCAYTDAANIRWGRAA